MRAFEHLLVVPPAQRVHVLNHELLLLGGLARLLGGLEVPLVKIAGGLKREREVGAVNAVGVISSMLLSSARLTIELAAAGACPSVWIYRCSAGVRALHLSI